ncbi:MAG: hypothetical protein WC415_05500 [Patescibacteria group bacterium]|jgi:hypothetical protein
MTIFNKENQNYNLFRDLGIIMLSIFVAVILVKTGILKNLLVGAAGVEFFGSFIAGMFFTSIFTAVPATIALGEIARESSLFWTAVLGGLGAMFGDLVIFRFVKNNLAQDFSVLLKHSSSKRLKAVFKLKFFRWFIAFLGALIIASPFPDELGLAMMGLTKIKTTIFIPLSFILNSLGILIIGLIARAL